MTIIAPRREGSKDLRFAAFISELTQTVNALVARPVNAQEADYTFLLTDAFTIVRKTSTTKNQTYTIPANVSVAFEIGHVLEVQNDGSVSLDIAIDTDTMTFEADGTTGTRTIGAAGSGRFVKVADTEWKARGQQMG